MFTLTFRNSQGALVNVPTIATTRVKNEFGAILERATHDSTVAITQHDTPKTVLLSYEEFESLVQLRSHSLDSLGTEFDDLLDKMQSPQTKKAMAATFNTSPAKLGRATVKRARKHG